MKKYLLAATAAFLLAMPLAASTRPAPGQFGLKGEWIYFCPAIEDSYFVVDSIQQSQSGEDADDSMIDYPQGDKYNNTFNYESGYRVEAIYAFCNCVNDVRVRWTQLVKHSHSVDVAGDSLYPTELAPADIFTIIPYAGLAGSKITMDYYALEALLGQLIYDCSPFTLEFQAGIQWGHLKFEEQLAYVETVIVPNRSSFLQFNDTFNGIGPEMAFDGDYALYNSDCCCPGTLFLTSSLRGALLIGNSKEEYHSLLDTGYRRSEQYQVENKKAWHVVPWWDMKLGLNYTSCFDCFTASVEVGYEAGSYIKAISKERFTDTTQKGYSFDQFQNFTYQGPYVAVEVIF